MAFTVQDGTTPVAGANAYITEQEFKDYHNERGNDIASLAGGDIQKAIIKATDYIDTKFRFKGTRVAAGQSTLWPRLDALDCEGDEVTGIPSAIKDATAEYAFIASSQDLNPNPTRDASGTKVELTKRKVGPLETETRFVEGSTFSSPKYPVADNIIKASCLTVNQGVLRA